jgi:Na+/proline symporter
MNGALAGIATAALLALGLGFLARRGRQMGLEQWTVAGRSFGAPLVFLLMAGEIYTTFTFLGGSGFAYGRRGPVYYILCYATLAYVMVSGVRGSAWTAVAKDAAILLVVVFLGIYFPLHYYRGLGAMFAAIEQAKPGFTALPERGESVWWFSSTVLLTALGFYMWPHSFGSIYTARNERVIRLNAVMLPIYQLILLFVFLIGFAAILQVPDLKGPDVDLALFKLSVKSFDPWLVGVIGAAGVLTALVPGSMILMTAATLFANNLYRMVHRSASDAHIVNVAKLFVPVVALVAIYFTLVGGQTIVTLLLMGYSFRHPAFSAADPEPRPQQVGHARGGGRRHRRGRGHGRRHQFQPRDHRYAVSCAAAANQGTQCRLHRAGGQYCGVGRRQRRGKACGREARHAGARFGTAVAGGLRVAGVSDRKEAQNRFLARNLIVTDGEYETSVTKILGR